MSRPSSPGPGQGGPTGAIAAMYEIRVAGHLDDHWAAMLDDPTLIRLGDGTTRLAGSFIDQAQLHGILARIRDLGVPLLTLRTFEPADQDFRVTAATGFDPIQR